MDKKDLVEIIDKEFKPLGFKRKGNYWQLIGEEIIKVIYLQRSSFSKLYYINYGFNLVNLDYDDVSMHIFHRLGSLDSKENELIKNLLDFENEIELETRKAKLTEVIRKILRPGLCKVNSEKDILSSITEDPLLLNLLSIKVKEYLRV